MPETTNALVRLSATDPRSCANTGDYRRHSSDRTALLSEAKVPAAAVGRGNCRHARDPSPGVLHGDQAAIKSR